MSITGYATSRSRSTAWTHLLSQELTRMAQEMFSGLRRVKLNGLNHANLSTLLSKVKNRSALGRGNEVHEELCTSTG